MTALAVCAALAAVTALVAWVVRQIQDAPLIGPDHPDFWTGRQIRSGERDAWVRREAGPRA